MMWNYYTPIIVYRRFLKPKIYKIINKQLHDELEKLFKHYGY